MSQHSVKLTKNNIKICKITEDYTEIILEVDYVYGRTDCHSKYLRGYAICTDGLSIWIRIPNDKNKAYNFSPNDYGEFTLDA